MNDARELTLPQREAFLETLQSNAKTPFHVPTVMFRAERRCGMKWYFPLNPAAEYFAAIYGKEMIRHDKLQYIRRLGFAIEINDSTEGSENW